MFFSVKNVTSTLITLVENDHRDDWSPEKYCFWRSLVRKLSSESIDSFSQLKIEVEKL